MTVLALKPTLEVDVFQEDFAANAARLPGAGEDWLDNKRIAAMQTFAATGIPTRRVEAWKYSDLAAALEGSFEPATRFHGPVSNSSPFSAIAGTRVTLANGFLQTVEKDDEAGIDVFDLGALGAKTP